MVLAPEIYLNKFGIIDFLVISFDFVLKIQKKIQFIFQMFFIADFIY